MKKNENVGYLAVSGVLVSSVWQNISHPLDNLRLKECNSGKKMHLRQAAIEVLFIWVGKSNNKNKKQNKK